MCQAIDRTGQDQVQYASGVKPVPLPYAHGSPKRKHTNCYCRLHMHTFTVIFLVLLDPGASVAISHTPLWIADEARKGVTARPFALTSYITTGVLRTVSEILC